MPRRRGVYWLRRPHLLFFMVFAFIVFCFCLQCRYSPLPLFLNASVALPYQNMRTISVSIRPIHIYQLATPPWALCRGGCCGGAGMKETQPTCTGIRCCLAPPAWPFLVFYVKASLFLYPSSSSCSFSPSVYLLLLGNVFERVFLDLLNGISFDLASVLQLFISLLVYL